MSEPWSSWFRQHWVGVLGAFFALCGLLVSGLWFYVQLQEWKKNGSDYMPLIANVLITVFLWLLLIAANAIYWKGSRRNFELEAELTSVKDESKLQIEFRDRELAGANSKIKSLESELEKKAITTPAVLAPSAPVQPTKHAPAFPSLSALYNQPVPANLTFADYFKRAYYSPITAEVEQNIQVAAHNDSPNDHEAFYIRLIGTGVVAYMHDDSWWEAFRSQILLLMELNRVDRTVPLSLARQFYDEAIPTCPKIYPQYTFEQWLDWLKSKALIAVYPSDMLEISHKGKDFLRYLAHVGRRPDDKVC
jgi:hypothetical protein